MCPPHTATIYIILLTIRPFVRTSLPLVEMLLPTCLRAPSLLLSVGEESLLPTLYVGLPGNVILDVQSKEPGASLAHNDLVLPVPYWENDLRWDFFGFALPLLHHGLLDFHLPLINGELVAHQEVRDLAELVHHHYLRSRT